METCETHTCTYQHYRDVQCRFSINVFCLFLEIGWYFLKYHKQHVWNCKHVQSNQINIPQCSVWGPVISPINNFIVELHVKAEVSEGHRFSCRDVEGDKVLSSVLGHFGVLIFILPPPVTLLIPVISSGNIPGNKYNSLEIHRFYIYITVNTRSLMLWYE